MPLHTRDSRDSDRCEFETPMKYLPTGLLRRRASGRCVRAGRHSHPRWRRMWDKLRDKARNERRQGSFALARGGRMKAAIATNDQNRTLRLAAPKTRHFICFLIRIGPTVV